MKFLNFSKTIYAGSKNCNVPTVIRDVLSRVSILATQKKKRKNIFASKTNDKSCQFFFFGNPAPILSRSEEVVHLRKKFHRSTVGFTSNGGVFDKRGAGFQKSKCYFHFGCSSSKHKNLDNLLLENFVGIACASTARSQKFGPYFVRKFFRDSLCLDGQVN